MRKVPAQSEPTSLWRGRSEVQEECITPSGDGAEGKKAEDGRVLAAKLVAGSACSVVRHPPPSSP